jgi:hypothetical protein
MLWTIRSTQAAVKESLERLVGRMGSKMMLLATRNVTEIMRR